MKENPEWWANSLIDEWGRLSLENNYNVEYTDTIEYINNDSIPVGKKTYAHYVYNYRPLKDEKLRVRLVVEGDKVVYKADIGSPTTDMVETKIFKIVSFQTKHKN